MKICEQDLIRAFHTKFGFTLNDTPSPIDERQAEDRSIILEEETNELRKALFSKDIIKIADAIADVVYVAKGTAVACGLDSLTMDFVFREVHRSNMTKEKPSGCVGKAIKGAEYSPPDLTSIIETKKRTD